MCHSYCGKVYMEHLLLPASSGDDCLTCIGVNLRGVSQQMGGGGGGSIVE